MTDRVGLYRCRNGTKTQWRVRWFGDYAPGSGKQKRYSKTFSRKLDAEKFQSAKAAELRSGAPRDLSTETLAEYCRWWLQYRAKGQGLRPATVGLYEGTIARLCAYFGDTTLLRQITAQAAEMFLAELRPKQGDKVLSSWTRSQILRQCKTLFGDAESRDFIARNPFKKLRGPKTSVTAWYYVDRGEYRKLLDVTPSLREQALYALCYTAGLRLTEAVALRWADIDFETGQVSVVRYPATDTLPPFDIKDNEKRTIPLPQQTIDLLLKVQAEAPDNVPYALMSKRRYERVVAKWQACRAEGRAWLNRGYGNNVLTRFRRRVRRAGIRSGGKSLTIHTLRKCCCQNWIQDGQPINVVKMLMGHADIGTTERHYSQVTQAQRQQVAATATARLQTPAAEAGADATDPKLTFSPVFACQEAGERR